MAVTPRQSWLVLSVLAILAFSWAFRIHQFVPKDEPDSGGYLNYDWSSLKSVLSNQRTAGYPLFLVGVRAISSDPRAIPLAHGLVLVFAAFVMLEGLVTAGYRRSTALCSAGTLLFGRALMKLGPNLIADSLASSLAIAAAGCFLASTKSPARRIAWCGLVVLTFACYQTRPAYLFLIPLWPVVSIAADRLILRRTAGWLPILRRGGCYALATMIPFLLHCTLRWAIVGHWGLVSFGGYNLIGVVGQFLDQASVAGLPDELQPVARRMLERRAQLTKYEPPDNFTAMEQMFNPTVWELAAPAAQELHGEDRVAVNRVLTELSSQLLWQHPRSYLRWLIWNGLHAVKQIVLLTVTDLGVGLLCLLFLVAHAARLCRGPPLQPPSPSVVAAADRAPTAAKRFLEMHLLFWTAVGFTAAKALLVILVEPANDRYMTGAMPLLPAVLAVFWVHALEVKSQRDA